jgi:hypothetical protein
MSRRLSLAAVLSLLLLAAPEAGAAAARTITPLPPQWQKGVSASAYWWQDLSGPRFATWLRKARTDARAKEITFVVTAYQYFSDVRRTDALNADEIHVSFGSRKLCRGRTGKDHRFCKTPSLGDLAAAVRRAHAQGFRVLIRPQVDVGRTDAQSKPRDLIDKGDADRRRWFDSYKAMLSRYARVARDTQAEGFVVGAGLSAMTNDVTDRNEWRAIVEQLRSGALMGDDKGFTGEVTYAAQWDSIVEDTKDLTDTPFFWDLLDSITIDAYFPVADGSAGGNPSVAALQEGWTTRAFGGLPQSPVALVRALHEEYDKPVRFTLGYLSQTGTATFPEKGSADNRRSGGKTARAPQFRAVHAAFDVWAPIATEGWFKGISWWEWPASGRGGVNDDSFSFQGKTAEVEICLRHAGVFSRACRPSKGAAG